MRLGAVIDSEGRTVVGLVDGPRIQVWESTGGPVKVIDNPGYTAQAGRRLATLRAMLAEGVEVVCTPPQGFCAHSHREAVRRSVRFIVVPPGTSVEELHEQGDRLAGQALAELSPELLAQGHHPTHEHAREHHERPAPGPSTG